MESHGYYVGPDGPVACYAQVYVDGVLMNPGDPAPPYALDQITTDRVQAIEYYAGAAQTPARYSRAGSLCGALVIWTRRNDRI